MLRTTLGAFTDPRARALFESLASWLPRPIAHERTANAVLSLLLFEATGAGEREGWPEGSPFMVIRAALRRQPSLLEGHEATDARVEAAVASFVHVRQVLETTFVGARPLTMRRRPRSLAARRSSETPAVARTVRTSVAAPAPQRR